MSAALRRPRPPEARILLAPALLVWPDVVLLVAGGWVVVGAVIEAAAWRAHRLGLRATPACFRAPPRVGPNGERVRITFLGDLQRGISQVAHPLARRLREEPPDLLVSSGDFVAHGEAPYYGILLDAFAHAGIDVPTRAVPGNHDLQPRRVRDATLGGALFDERFGARRWALETGPVWVVGIDDAVGAVEGEQMAWLRAALAAREAKPWIAVCHRPPRNVDEDDPRAERDLGALIALLEADPPLLVVCGHKHAYSERTVNGVLYVVNALGGDVHGFALRRGPFELLTVEVEAEGAWRREVTRHRRRPCLRALVHQACVRCWAARRKGTGALLVAPVATLLRVLHLRAPGTQGGSPSPAGS